MDLLEFIEGKIDEQIKSDYDIYSLDSMTGSQLVWAREKYYLALWKVVKEKASD